MFQTRGSWGFYTLLLIYSSHLIISCKISSTISTSVIVKVRLNEAMHIKNLIQIRPGKQPSLNKCQPLVQFPFINYANQTLFQRLPNSHSEQVTKQGFELARHPLVRNMYYSEGTSHTDSYSCLNIKKQSSILQQLNQSNRNLLRFRSKRNRKSAP